MNAYISLSIEQLSLGLLIKTTFSILFVIGILQFTKSRTERSPYDHIPGPKPSSLIGYALDVHNQDDLDFHYKMTERYGHVARLRKGILGSDGLYISDPLALHTILNRDLNIFRESTEFAGLFGIVTHGDSLGSVWGNEHKKQRKLINPVFTSVPVSKLSPLFYQIANELRDKLAADIKSASDKTVDIMDFLTRAALELISHGAIGHTFNSLNNNSKEFRDFHQALKDVLPAASKLFLLIPFFESWRKMEPVWFRRGMANLAYYTLPWPALHTFMNAVDTIKPVYAQVFREKKAAFDEGGIAALSSSPSGGRDVATSLLKANMEAEEKDKIPDETIVANMSAMVLAGQETTAAALSRMLSLMSLYLNLQTSLREEITEALAQKNGEPLDYYELNDLPRLDAACKEALRLFPPVTFVWRQTMQDTVLPLQFPFTDLKTGKQVREVFVTKGTSVYIGVAATNRSTALWGTDAAKFKPERWIGHNAHGSTAEKIKTPGIFSTTMTFLGGERGCPGMKFALLEIKTVMAVLLPAFYFEKTNDIVDWRIGITLTPSVRGKESEGPQVPMKVTLIEEKA